jgi:hypothetical protein
MAGERATLHREEEWSKWRIAASCMHANVGFPMKVFKVFWVQLRPRLPGKSEMELLG